MKTLKEEYKSLEEDFGKENMEVFIGFSRFCEERGRGTKFSEIKEDTRAFMNYEWDWQTDC